MNSCISCLDYIQTHLLVFFYAIHVYIHKRKEKKMESRDFLSSPGYIPLIKHYVYQI